VTRNSARTAAAVVLSVTFAVAAHFAIVEGLAAQVGALLSLVPLAWLLFFLTRRFAQPLAAPVMLVAATAAAWLAFPALKAYFPSLLFIEHAGGQLLLAVVFGRTLMPNREPLVAQFATAVHGPLAPEVARYCRAVTVAWTAFFCVLFAFSCGLYLSGHLAAWSVLVNMLGPVLLGTMFLVEYFVRYRALPGLERVGFMRGAAAFSRHFGAAQAQSPR
jgi:uncharacterized membrane protein